MAFELNSRIKIGKYAFPGGVYELVIKKNIHVIVDTAKLEIPGLGQIVSIKSIADSALELFGYAPVKVTQKLPDSSVQTAQLFKEGDPVSIDLGDNGDYQNEFRGFVRRVNLTTPVSIEMEGYAWQLRSQNILQSWATTTVKDVLQLIIKGTDIVLSPDIPNIPLTDFHLRNQSGLECLEYLKTKALLTVCFADNVLYAGIEEGRTTTNNDGSKSLTGLAEVKYNIGYNCPSKQPDLKQRLGKDNLVRVRLTVRQKNGKRILYEAGDVGGAVTAINMPALRDNQNLADLAAAKLKRLKYDGFEGKINAFLQPYCLPGWKATLTDKRYAGARAGTYFVPGIEVHFGAKGARRITEINYRLDGGN
jgi:hypothetical protein